jgi:hypothetical protein
MRKLYWMGIAGLSILPLSTVIIMVGKLLHGEPMGVDDAIGAAVGLFGLIAATVLYRERLLKKPGEKRIVK